MIRLFKFLIKLSIFAAIAWACGFVWFVGQIPTSANSYSVGKHKTPVGVALTGGSGRISYGLQKLHEKRFDVLFISGVNKEVSVDELFSSLPNADLNQKIHTLYKDEIIIGREARSTRGNAIEVGTYLNRIPIIGSFILITSDYHMPRSLLEFRRVITDSIKIIPEPYITGKLKGNWWRNKATLNLIMNEYHKYMISYIAGEISKEQNLSEILENNPF